MTGKRSSKYLSDLKTSWVCTGPSSAKTGTGTLFYFIQDLLHKIDSTMADTIKISNSLVAT